MGNSKQLWTGINMRIGLRNIHLVIYRQQGEVFLSKFESRLNQSQYLCGDHFSSSFISPQKPHTKMAKRFIQIPATQCIKRNWIFQNSCRTRNWSRYSNRIM